MEEWERLLSELRAEFLLREKELELLHAIDLKLLGAEPPTQDIFEFIVKQTQKLLGATHTTILLRRSTFLEPMYSNLKSVIGQRVPIGESMTGYCLQIDDTVSEGDLTSSTHIHRYTPLRGYRGKQMHSLLATPIRIGGQTVGVLNAESPKRGAFWPVHGRVVRNVAAQIGIALQRTQLVSSDVIFADVDRMMFADGDSQEPILVALEKVMSELRRLEHVEHTGAQIMFLDGDHLEIVHSTNPADVGTMVAVDQSVSGQAVTDRRTVIVGDVNENPLYQRMLGDSIRSEIAVPILFGEDAIVIGVLNVESEEQDAFYGFYQIVLESFAAKVGTLLAFAKLRANVTDVLELRSADDLLVAVGDQTSHLIHRLNNTVGAMRHRVIALQNRLQAGTVMDGNYLSESLDTLRNLAERTLKMPDDVTRLLGRGGNRVQANDTIRLAVKQVEQPKNVRLELNLSDNIPALPLYSFDIVVQNLLQNAIDAMPDGGLLSVSTCAVYNRGAATGYFQLKVSDTGVGITADVQKKMFDLNFTTKNSRGRGLGLGLWWVRNFVRRSAGDITIRSVVGRGTEVVVKIPLDRPGKISRLADGQLSGF
jgi:signal transduction histidine kinase